MSEADFELASPFFTDDPAFALGVEFGLLHAELKEGPPHVHTLIHRENEDRVLVLLDRMGYEVRERAKLEGGWMAIHAVKKWFELKGVL